MKGSDGSEEMKRDWKVLCLGLDGATMDLILPWVEAGKLPTFKYLMDSGSFGELESVIQPCSAQAWTSFMTGKNPGKHGIFGFRKQFRGSYKHTFVNGSMVTSKTIWRVLSDYGKRVFVMNVPLTYPPDTVNGCLVSGMDAPGTESDFTYPPEIRKELMEATDGRYVITVHLGGYLTSDRKRENAVDKLLDMAEQRTKGAMHFLRTRSWDFAMVKYDIPDQAHHYFWKYLKSDGSRKFGDAIYRIYAKLDEIVARFLREIDKETVLILLSDHGGGPHSGKVVYVNEWLRRQGLLTPPFDGKGGNRIELRPALNRLLRRAMHWLYYSVLLRVLRDNTKDLLWRLFPKFRSDVSSYLKFSRLDWTKTRAHLGGNLDEIRLNVRGREPEGIVEPGEEYDRVRDEIISGLQSIRDPETREPIFERIYKKEEVYSGEFVDEAPDILLVPKAYAYSLRRDLLCDDSEPLVARRKHQKGISGIHRMNGITFLFGGPIRGKRRLDDAKIIDLAPTILHLMGFPVPDDMDGKVLTKAFRESFANIRPLRHSKSEREGKRERKAVYTDQEAHTIREHLKGLGYID